jgi:hypothetical protein
MFYFFEGELSLQSSTRKLKSQIKEGSRIGRVLWEVCVVYFQKILFSWVAKISSLRFTKCTLSKEKTTFLYLFVHNDFCAFEPEIRRVFLFAVPICTRKTIIPLITSFFPHWKNNSRR